MSFRDVWAYDGSEPEILLFSHGVKAWGINIAPDSRVLELGCCETDFARRLKAAVPGINVTGIDVRDGNDFTGDTLIIGDAAKASTYAGLEPFDWVISLGAVEHFGLGWYGDPKDAYGDSMALYHAVQYLKPGGHLYFDVPWTPATYHETGHYRCYDDRAIAARVQPRQVTMRARGWVPNTRERDDFTQVRPMVVHEPFYFMAQWGQKG